ncbi:MAG: transporter substrate-binding domain-containing protein [Pseudomonadota bacterium]
MKLVRPSIDMQFICICKLVVMVLFSTALPCMIAASPGVQLSAEEQAWLDEHPTIRLGVDPDWPPIEFFSAERGYQGVTSEYIAYFREKLMLTLEPVEGLAWAEVLGLAQKGEVDLLPALGKTPERSTYLNFTDPYLSFPFVAFTREGYPFISGLGELSNKRVAVVGGYAVREMIEADFPGLRLILVDNPLEGLLRLSRGEVDAYAGNLVVGSYLIRKQELSNLKVGAPTSYRFELRMGVRKDWPELIPILQKLLDNMSDEQKMAIRDRWLSIRYDVDVDYSLLWKVVLASLVVLGVALLWLIQMRRQREALRRSEERYHLAMDAVSEAVWEWNLSSGKRYFSPGFFYHLGYSQSEIPQNDEAWRALLHPDDRQAQSETNQQVDQFDRTLVMEFRVKRKQGGYVDVQSRSKVVERDSSGNAVLRRGTLRDITAQKKVESELRKLSEAVEHSPSMVIITNVEGDIEYVNPKFTDVTGYAADEVLGRTPHFFQSGLTESSIYEDLWQTIKSGREWRGEFQDRKKSGEIFWESISISVVKDAEGAITHYVGVEEDITVRKEAESLLALAKEEAEQASRFKSSFLANMSHEIRTPVNAIMGMAYLAMQTDLSRQQSSYINKIKISARNLLAIIDDVLDISKIEAGRMEIEETAFQLDEILENLSSMVSLKAEEKGLEIIFKRDPNVPGALLGDPLRIGQVLSNFMQNAIKFTEAGEVVVSIQLVNLHVDTAEIAFSVSDTGIGIQPESIGHLFENFVQADSSTSRQYGGAGLGLSISKQLIELMHGRLTVKSDPGVGSQFRFVLNLKLQKDDFLRAVKPDERSSREITTVTSLSGKVLLVEDNEINQAVARELLENFGLQVVIASEGREAIQKLRAGDFDLVLMDIQMPGMDGYETTREIRHDKRFLSIPILAITAHVMASDLERCLAAGMNDYLAKPIEPERLLEILRSWLNGLDDRRRTPRKEHEAGSVLPDKLSGIDLDRGLVRIGGNQALFYKLLRGFLQQHGNCCDRIEQLLGDDACSEAAHYLHTLQGVSGNIGALELQRTSLDLGDALHAGGRQDLAELKSEFCVSADRVVQEIRRFLGRLEREGLAADRSVVRIEDDGSRTLDFDILHRISTLLQDGDPDVKDLLESLTTMMDVSQAGVAEQIALLQSQAADYEYDAALETLHKLTLNI